MADAVDTVRQQWEEGSRRIAAEQPNRDVYELLMDQVDAVTEELRRRIGEHFTLAELADAYASADAWVLEAVEERGGRPGWTRRVADAQDAAFYLYARGATDYSP